MTVIEDTYVQHLFESKSAKGMPATVRHLVAEDYLTALDSLGCFKMWFFLLFLVSLLTFALVTIKRTHFEGLIAMIHDEGQPSD